MAAQLLASSDTSDASFSSVVGVCCGIWRVTAPVGFVRCEEAMKAPPLVREGVTQDEGLWCCQIRLATQDGGRSGAMTAL
jgi:hypothetical protein